MPLETPIGAVIAGNVNNATPAKPTMDSAKLSFLPMFTLPDLELERECPRAGTVRAPLATPTLIYPPSIRSRETEPHGAPVDTTTGAQSCLPPGLGRPRLQDGHEASARLDA